MIAVTAASCAALLFGCAHVTAIPIPYMGRNGKQYVAVVAATNGQGNNESLHVFALPSFAPGATAGKP